MGSGAIYISPAVKNVPFRRCVDMPAHLTDCPVWCAVRRYILLISAGVLPPADFRGRLGDEPDDTASYSCHCRSFPADWQAAAKTCCYALNTFPSFLADRTLVGHYRYAAAEAEPPNLLFWFYALLLCCWRHIWIIGSPDLNKSKSRSSATP